MKEFIKRYSLIITFVIALLHSFTPHSHAKESATDLHLLQEHLETNPVKGFLQHAFEVNLGQNHLENFLKTNCYEFTAVFAFASVGYFHFNFLAKGKISISQFVSKEQTWFRNPYLAHHFPLRAPPSKLSIIG